MIEIPLRFNKGAVFRNLCNDTKMLIYEDFDNVYKELEEEILEMAKNIGLKFMLKEFPEFSKWVHLQILLGFSISRRSKEYFENNEVIKGVMIDQMSNQILLGASNDFYTIIRTVVRN
ncbi:MAG: hypothetical protein ACRCU3_06695 [Eubacteriaceae bacterium]